MGLREQLATPVMAAEVLYDAADPYTRKVIIDKGMAQGVDLGSPVLDESGVLGQVTRVHPLVSEVTLLVDRDLAIPVLNVRTGARSVAYGDPTVSGSGLELRFMGSNSDVQQGDLLTTSGVDGVYPAGPAGGQDQPHRAARRVGVCQDFLHAAGAGDGRAARHRRQARHRPDPAAAR
jgi:rod shape-determining protein MreC